MNTEMKTKVWRVYISLPINSRMEETFQEKRIAAALRCERLKRVLHRKAASMGFKVDFVTPFDANPVYENISEAEALGRCITSLLGCDVIYQDHGCMASRGCCLESVAANIYGLFTIRA